MAALPAARDSEARHAAGSYLRAAHHLRVAPADQRAAYLELAARRTGPALLAERTAALPVSRVWRPRWAAWQAEGNQHILGRHNGSLMALACTALPDGRVVAISADYESVRVWDLMTASPLPAVPHAGGAAALTCATLPDGRVVAVSAEGDESVRVWDLMTGSPLPAAPVAHDGAAHDGAVTVVACAALPDGRVAGLAGTSTAILAWDLATGEPVGASLVKMPDLIWGLASATLPDGRPVAVVRTENAIRVWDVMTGQALGVRTRIGVFRTSGALACGTLPDGTCVAVAVTDHHEVQAWQIPDLQPIGGRMSGHINAVPAIACTALPDGRAVAVTVAGSHGGFRRGTGRARPNDDMSVRVWDLPTGQPIGAPLTGHTEPIEAVACATLPDGRVVAVTGAEDRTLRVWDLTYPPPAVRPHDCHDGRVWAVACADIPAGRPVAVSGGDDKTVRVWDLETGEPACAPLSHPNGSIRAVSCTAMPGGRTIAVTADRSGIVLAQDLTSRRTVRKLDLRDTLHVSGRGIIPSLSCANLLDGRIIVAVATANRDRAVSTYDLLTQQPASTPFTGHTSWVNSVACVTLPGGRVAVVSGSTDDTARIWDLASGQPIGRPLTGHTGPIEAVACAALPDGRALAVTSGYDKTIRVWDLLAGKPIAARLTAHSDEITAIACAVMPDGTLIAVTGSEDHTINIWTLPVSPQPAVAPETTRLGALPNLAALIAAGKRLTGRPSDNPEQSGLQLLYGVDTEAPVTGLALHATTVVVSTTRGLIALDTHPSAPTMASSRNAEESP